MKDEDKNLEQGLEESMDASDSPTAIRDNNNEPVPSSGFPEKKSWLDRVKDKLFNK